MTEKKVNLTVPLAFVAAVILFGGNYVAVSICDRELQPIWGATLRLAFAAIAILVWIKIEKIHFPRGRALAFSFAYGFLAFPINLALLYWGLESINSGFASVLYASVPMVTLFIAVPFSLEELKWRAPAGAIVGLAGVAVIFSSALGLKLQVLPLLAVAAGAICTASAGVLLKTRTIRDAKPNPASMTAIGAVVGCLTLACLAIGAGEKIVLPVLPATWEAIAWLIAGTAIGYSLSVYLYKQWSASSAALTNICAPLITVPAAALLLSSKGITSAFIVGASLVLVGTYVSAVYCAKGKVN